MVRHIWHVSALPHGWLVLSFWQCREMNPIFTNDTTFQLCISDDRTANGIRSSPFMHYATSMAAFCVVQRFKLLNLLNQITNRKFLHHLSLHLISFFHLLRQSVAWNIPAFYGKDCRNRDPLHHRCRGRTESSRKIQPATFSHVFPRKRACGSPLGFPALSDTKKS